MIIIHGHIHYLFRPIFSKPISRRLHMRRYSMSHNLNEARNAFYRVTIFAVNIYEYVD